MVRKAQDYQWSSAAAHVTDKQDRLLAQPSWLADTQRTHYKDFITHSDTEAEEKLRSATRTGRPFGSEIFIDEMEELLGMRLRPRKPGRPKKSG